VCCLFYNVWGGYRIASHRTASTTSHPCTNSRPSHPPQNAHADNPPCFPNPRPRPHPHRRQRIDREHKSPSRKRHRGLPSRRRRLPSSRTRVRVRTARTAQTVPCNAMPLCCRVLASAPVDCDMIQYTIRQVQSACVASEQTRTHALTPFRGVALVAGATDG
jgi:hypothetical protein